MNTTIKIQLDKRVRNNDNEYSIVFRITHKRVQTTIQTGYKVTEDNFNIETKSIKRGTKTINKEKANRRIAIDYAKYSSVINKLYDSGKLKHLSTKELRKELLNDFTSTDFFEFSKKYLETEIKNKMAGNTYTIYENTLIRFERAINKSAIDINAIDVDTLKQVEKTWRETGLATNTINLYFSKIKHLLNIAIHKNVLKEEKFPFKRYSHEMNKYSFSGEKTVKRSVDIEFIQLFEKYSTKSRARSFARDIFLFSFYTRGTNISNMILLRKSNIEDGVLSYRRRKTNALITIQLHRKAYDILLKYDFENKESNDFLFPFKLKASVNDKQGIHEDIKRITNIINDRLEDVCKDLGVKKVTTYAARHSWASIASKNGIDLSIIKAGLGHSSIRTTEIYINDLQSSDTLSAADEIIMG